MDSACENGPGPPERFRRRELAGRPRVAEGVYAWPGMWGRPGVAFGLSGSRSGCVVEEKGVKWCEVV